MGNTISSVRTFLSRIDAIAEMQQPGYTLFFRGHGDRIFKLEPSVYRKRPWFMAEDRMYKEMILENPADFADDRSTLEKLVKMQHHSLPTRLLDLTQNPLVALYFACKSEKKPENILEPTAEVVVLSIPDKDIRFYDSDTVSVLSNLAKRPYDEKNGIKELLKTGMEVKDFNTTLQAKQLVHEIREEKPYFDAKLVPGDLERVVCVIAKRNNKRVVVQNGAFLLFGLGEEDGRPALVPQDWILHPKKEKILIKGDAKPKILTELGRLNIRASTLFPDIETTALHIKTTYEAN